MADKDKLNYWETRAVEQDAAMHKELKKPELAIISAYIKAQEYLKAETKKIYRRYADESSLADDAMDELLNTKAKERDILGLIAMLKTVKDKRTKRQIKQYLNVLAAKDRISRLEMLRAKAYVVTKQVADVELRRETDFLTRAAEQAYQQASVESVIGQAEHDVKLNAPSAIPNARKLPNKMEFSNPETGEVLKSIDLQPEKPVKVFKELSTKQTQDVLDIKWYGGNYSSRIWKNTDALAGRLSELFTAQRMSGMRERDMAKALENEFSVSAYQARRLIRTEANFIAGQAKLKGWKAHGIKQYVLVAVLDFRTSAICRKLDGRVYAIEDAKCAGADGNYPPFHAFCRTVATAYFGKKTFVGTHQVNNPLGRSFEMPAGTTYRAWEKALIDKYGQEKVDLAQKKADNFTEDSQQYDRFKEYLGDIMPDFDEFQSMKYEDADEWVSLNDHVYVKERLANGTFGNEIHWGKQNNHLTGEHPGANTTGKSLFDEGVDVEALFKKYAGTGVNEGRLGRRVPKELINLGHKVGTDARTGLPMYGFKIHYSKKGAHLVPWKGEKT